MNIIIYLNFKTNKNTKSSCKDPTYVYVDKNLFLKSDKNTKKETKHKVKCNGATFRRTNVEVI